jgi:hypothetical protein
MDRNTIALWILFVIAAVALGIHLWAARSQQRRREPFRGPRGYSSRPFPQGKEGFITVGGALPGPSLMDMSTQALDAAPTTSEAKTFYKQLLLFADSDIRQQGTAGLRILADFRDRVYGPRDFKASLTVDDFLANWPAWLPPLDPTIKEPTPTKDDAVMAEARLLAYLQKNFPQEDMVDEQTGSTIRNLVEDFGKRFVFEANETVALRPDFLSQPILKGWVNPAARS